MYIQSVAHIADVMARLRRDEVLKKRISEATGMPIGDINAQNSRCSEKYRYFCPIEPAGKNCTSPLN